MYYQEVVDEVLGECSPHRTLRTLFDNLSDEWTRTTLDQKIDILERILNSDKIELPGLLMEYRHYYTEELSNKAYVIDKIEDSLEILLQHALTKKLR